MSGGVGAASGAGRQAVEVLNRIGRPISLDDAFL